jgi:maleylpyruvate isomerase
MGDLGLRPPTDLARVEEAQARFVAVVAGTVDDTSVGEASGLPGWTVGHVLTHVARNADSHRRRTEAAVQGVVVEQYAGGWAGRAAEIEAGAARSARDLIDDVRRSADLMMQAWASVPAPAWATTTPDVSGRERPLHELPARRWQELEVHLVDLAVGYTFRDWPETFVSVWLPQLRAGLSHRLPADATVPDPARFVDEREELAWLYGRIPRPDLPVLAPWA